MIRGAIFDVDGTLLDSMSVWNNMGADYLRSLGRVPRAGLNQTLQSMSLAQAAGYLRRTYDLPLSEEQIIEGVNRRIAGFYRERARLKPGALDFLLALKARGVGLCAATATDLPYVQSALEREGAADLFSHIFTCAQVGRGKDDPEIYRQALARLGAPKARTVVFEDALYALRTAKAAGFPTAAVYDRYEPQPEELRALADVFIADYGHLDDFWKFASGL